MDAAAAFGLSREPFQRNCETDEQCLPNPLAALLSELQAGLRSPQGLSVLIAEEGSGKTLLARIFARRLAGRARAALIASPGPTVATIVRDALGQLGVDLTAGSSEDELVRTLIDVATRRAAGGGSTAIVIDDAHRLSPQTLAGLARLFCEEAEEPPCLHLFLFGRPDLLDRMNATADRALLEHLLQICRIEPLGVRDCIRYLERRLAAAAGELATLFAPEAIDDLIVAGGGRVLRLESLAAAALERAARAGSGQVRSEHVHTWSGAEGTAMAGEQQKLRLDRLADGQDDDEVSWGDEGEEDEWTTDDGSRDEVRLSWGASDEDDEESFQAGDEEEDEESPPPRKRESRRGSVIFMGVFSAAACVLLTWAANSIESPEHDAAPGRTTEMFPKTVASEPTEIVRLPVPAPRKAAAEKPDGDDRQARPDANAHLALWSSRDTSIDTHTEDEVEIRELDAEVPEYDGEVMWEEELAASEREKPRFPKRDLAEREKAAREAAERDRNAREAAERASTQTAQRDGRAAAMPPGAFGDARADGGKAPAGIAEAMGGGASDVDEMDSYEEEAPRVMQAKAAVLTQPPSSRPKPASSAPAPRKEAPPATASKAPAAKASGTTLYTIQLGAFRTRANAEQLVARLGGRRVRIVSDAGMFRVLSGAFESRQDATAHEASLRRAGFTTFLRSQVF
ncbi:MAG TPA: AAA family ATPase [Candidatus Binatia bacterium]|nr:AAA family ATPase [Candidatus Binatia bacterium]